jgi:hypothetical protein
VSVLTLESSRLSPPEEKGGTRVASASSSSPPHAETLATGGWIDLQGIATKLHLPAARVKQEWEPLGAALK